MVDARQQDPGFVARRDAPLIGVLGTDGDQEVVRYYTDSDNLDAASGDRGVRRALGLAGAWGDLDWTEAERNLDHIRHDSDPTPPFEL